MIRGKTRGGEGPWMRENPQMKGRIQQDPLEDRWRGQGTAGTWNMNVYI